MNTAIFLVIATFVVLFLSRILNKKDNNEVQLHSPAFSFVSNNEFANWLKLVVSLLLSVSLLVFSMYIITSESADGEGKKFAYGTIGTILGYWLKNEKAI